MSKKLKIKFWKAERALAMQILEQEGLPEVKEEGVVRIVNTPSMYEYTIFLRGNHHPADFDIDCLYFETNSERDEYLDKMTQAITDELFTGTGELKVGEMCEVKDLYDKNWKQRRLLAILPKRQTKRYIAEHDQHDHLSWAEARPLRKRTEPKVEENGEIITYTWEEK